MYATHKMQVLFAVAIAALVEASSASFAAQPFDGRWSVRAFPNAKGCDGLYQFPVQVTAGSVTYIGRGTVKAEGGVEADGSVEVSFIQDGDRLIALGLMSDDAGKGTWKSLAEECSGTWIARRN
jgi:hypothetical protein